MVGLGYTYPALGSMAIKPGRQPGPRVRMRSARKEDLYDVARVYLRAFPDSLTALHSPQLSALAVGDVMRASRCSLTSAASSSLTPPRARLPAM